MHDATLGDFFEAVINIPVSELMPAIIIVIIVIMFIWIAES